MQKQKLIVLHVYFVCVCVCVCQASQMCCGAVIKVFQNDLVGEVSLEVHVLICTYLHACALVNCSFPQCRQFSSLQEW